MGKRLGFVLVCLLFSIGIAVAQNTVSGTVLGDDGLPVIGATVMVKGTKTGTATDIDGNFSISTTGGSSSVGRLLRRYEDLDRERCL